MAIYRLISKSTDGWMNLAVDEFLLGRQKTDDVILYFYVNKNAVIIGRNQNAWRECRLDAMERDGVRLVRRHTGGGAVYHDEGNLNFSFITGERSYSLDRQMGVIRRAVERFGIKTELSGRNDVLADGRKFSGNAYGLRGNMRAHHGTLLVNSDMAKLGGYLNVSEKKLRAKGVESVRSRVINLSELCPDITVQALREAVLDEFEKEYGSSSELKLEKNEHREIERLYREQASWEWRLGKTPEFDVMVSERLSFGEFELLLTLKGAAVDDAKMHTDALDTELSHIVCDAICGKRFDRAEIADALFETGVPQAAEIAEYILANGFFTGEING